MAIATGPDLSESKLTTGFAVEFVLGNCVACFNQAHLPALPRAAGLAAQVRNFSTPVALAKSGRLLAGNKEYSSKAKRGNSPKALPTGMGCNNQERHRFAIKSWHLKTPRPAVKNQAK